MRRTTFSIATVLSMVLLLCSVPSQAQGSPATPSNPGTKWTWKAPRECPSQDALQTQIEKHLGRSLVETKSAVKVVSATVHRRDTNYLLTIRMHAAGAPRERTLQHQDCLALANAASVIVAIVLDPSSAERLADDLEAAPADPQENGTKAEHRREEDDEATRSKSSNGKKDPSQDEPVNRKHTKLHFELQAALSGLIGPLPKPSLGAELALALVSNSWRNELYGGAWLPQTMALPELEDAEARFVLWSLGLRSGPSLRWGPWRWTVVSLGAEAGRFSVKATGLQSAQASNTLWVVAGLGSALHVAISDSLQVLLRLEGLLTLRSNEYTADNYGTLHVPDRFGGRLQLGLAWSLGSD